MLILIAKLAKEKPSTLNFALNIRNRFSDYIFIFIFAADSRF